MHWKSGTVCGTHKHNNKQLQEAQPAFRPVLVAVRGHALRKQRHLQSAATQQAHVIQHVLCPMLVAVLGLLHAAWGHPNQLVAVVEVVLRHALEQRRSLLHAIEQLVWVSGPGKKFDLC